MCRLNDRNCAKHFPKQLRETTEIDASSFVNYKRRSTDVTITIDGYVADNRWVVPYNPYLCTKYDAHINVEYCAGNAAIKYLFKYIHKGSDRSNHHSTCF